MNKRPSRIVVTVNVNSKNAKSKTGLTKKMIFAPGYLLKLQPVYKFKISVV